jgi:hypothetical protein
VSPFPPHKDPEASKKVECPPFPSSHTRTRRQVKSRMSPFPLLRCSLGCLHFTTGLSSRVLVSHTRAAHVVEWLGGPFSKFGRFNRKMIVCMNDRDRQGFQKFRSRVTMDHKPGFGTPARHVGDQFASVSRRIAFDSWALPEEGSQVGFRFVEMTCASLRHL